MSSINAEIRTTTAVPTPSIPAPVPDMNMTSGAPAGHVIVMPAPEPFLMPDAADVSVVGSDADASSASAAGTTTAPGAASLTAEQKASKSKKKKDALTVTMATAATAQSGALGAAGENTGRWTAEEHRLFLQGLEQHGKGWKKIASLIKSRTVVQIRTHAQKYFQKLTKARQNGEEGDVAMEGRGGTATVPPVTTSAAQTNKRRRQTSGTKRKSIQSVVSSAQRQGKKIAVAMANNGVQNPIPPLPAVAPALSHYVIPPQPNSHANTTTTSQCCIPSITTAQGTISGPALEDSLYVNLFCSLYILSIGFALSTVRFCWHVYLFIFLLYSFRFLTPAPVSHSEPQVNVNEVARQAGANPITLPSDQPSPAPSGFGGEISPTGVADFALYPSWTDAKDTPSWYAKGSDVDALLDVADTLDWLTDTGDLHENYQPSTQPEPGMEEIAPSIPEMEEEKPAQAQGLTHTPSVNNMSMNTLPRVDSAVDVVVPPLPSLFDGAQEENEPTKKLSMQHHHQHHMTESTSSATLDETIDEHLHVFDTSLEEHDFVSTILENTGESSNFLSVLS
jgi:SHAQKYF class myb-like DNA-binding protein